MRLRETVIVLMTLLAGASGRAQTAMPAPPSVPASAAVGSASAASAQPLTAKAVRAAARAVDADPLLPGMEKTKILRFKKHDDEDKDEPKKDPEDARWWLNLVENLSTGMRVAIWLIGAALLVWVVLRLRDWLKGRDSGRAASAAPPTHVGTLDIRPESLPADIGAAARALWARQEPRAALSLLYRGALSRLVHVHGVPIRAASTEQECLDLATDRLAPPSHAFLRQLVAGWQTVAYAQRALDPAVFEQLCTDFDTCLSPGGQP
ncbi:DUF4129 domain-containing protein [Roseateles amylovorans]|uniref:DUF4129 domain-containing protein n=1 Tax=Roseateles amylovorans TaxID=2978473 RepID=A0ABY6B4I5_9BURK|nr:DUF4129 domain-containing protein [Roseateles amylovorans]UXH79646.1 DUF4129 domain-containing protein [Roseateles amylovorans]